MSEATRVIVKTRGLISLISLAIIGHSFIGAYAEAAAELPDPTRPPFLAKPRVKSRPTPKPKLVLQVTLISPERRIAIINGRSYVLGSTIRGAVLTEIRPYEVTLRRNGREIRLRLVATRIDHESTDEVRFDGHTR